MAEKICRRKFKSERKAARQALEGHGEVVTERHLTRVYAGQRREIEVKAMRGLATWNIHFSGTGVTRLLEIPERWQALMEHVEAAVIDRNDLQLMKEEFLPDVPVHRWYPGELLDFIEKSDMCFPEEPIE